jgi:hypothetical protein
MGLSRSVIGLLNLQEKQNTSVYHEEIASKIICGRKIVQTIKNTKQNCKRILNDKSSIKRRHKKVTQNKEKETEQEWPNIVDVMSETPLHVPDAAVSNSGLKFQYTYECYVPSPTFHSILPNTAT